MSVRRYDIGELRKPERLPSGFLRVDAFLTRVGVFEYRNHDGSIRRELRLPDEVFHPDALASFSQAPLTLEHPDVGFLDASNAAKYSVGSVGENVRKDGETFVRAALMVTHSDAIADVEAKRRQEVSCGYSCDLEEKSGEWGGQKYDCIQRHIRGNHVALVERGRAGPEVRVRMDGTDAVQVVTTGLSDEAPNKEQPMVKFTVDGIEYEGTEQVKQLVAKLSARADSAAEGSKAELAQTKKELEATKAKLDASTEDVQKKDAALKEAVDPKRVSGLVKARVALETSARRLLGKEAKLDGLGEREVMAAALHKASPDLKLDGKSDDYVQARFEAALERADGGEDDDVVHEDSGEGLGAVRRALDSTDRTDANPVAAARKKQAERNREAWKPKKSA